MIKIISLFVFISAFIWSWMMFNSKTDLSLETHAALQGQLSSLIENSIKEKRPLAAKFNLIKMYTEKLNSTEVKAFFTYEYQDNLVDANDEKTENNSTETVTQKISGEALLSLGLSDNSQIQNWVLKSVKTDNQSLDFKEGLSIKGSQIDSSTPDTEIKAIEPNEPQKSSETK